MKTPTLSVPTLLVLGIVFHLIYSWSIFDIYFTSPLVHGMTPVEPPAGPPAKRLVLAVADGLRADKLFENAMSLAPFLHSIVEERGTWGISHTRVPTESRPGHVALIAGFYEDVSAVTKGWKMNPVNFDSVFNQTFKTWSFGSPDILPMFAHGASDPNRVEMFMYPAESEDFAGSDASKLDIFVFDKFEDLLKRAKSDENLHRQLHSDKIIFFLHLLGIDTNGHGHRPHSREYLDNIRIVDKGLARVEKLLQDFYQDDKTAFVVTADHGMSNRGSHGDGHPDNTRTPIVAWGAGLARPNEGKPTGHDEISHSWGLDHISRHDVEQADIAPLMSTLVGIPYPMNSVGVLPLPFLNNTNNYKALATFGNAKQIFAQFLVKESLKRKTALYFRPFLPLQSHAALLFRIQTAIDNNQIAEAEALSFDLINLSLNGLNYYQKYDWFFLKSVITLGYLGWMSYCIIFLIQKYAKEPRKMPWRKKKTGPSSVPWNALAFTVLSGMSVMLYLKKSPFQYYLYVLFPVFFWTEVIKKRGALLELFSSVKADRHLGKTLAEIVLYIVGLELLIYSYFQREILSYMLVAAGILWPVVLGSSFRSDHPKLILFWLLSCVASSVFTLLPVEKGENIFEVTAGGLMILLSGLAATQWIPSVLSVTQRSSNATLWIQLVILAASIVVVNDTSARLAAKSGLPYVNQMASYIILVICIFIPIYDRLQGEHHYIRRATGIYLSFAPVFVLLSISYETLFYFCFSNTLLAWLLLERELHLEAGPRYGLRSKSELSSITFSELRVAMGFSFFVNLAFFGTGNIASVSSFSLESVYRFTTVFDPFLMGAFLILKMLIPFFLLSTTYGLLSRLLSLPPFSLFLLVLSTTDLMTLNFFFLVRDTGSWLEIGTTISHFIIASTFIIFQIILFSVSHLLIGSVSLGRGGRGLLTAKKDVRKMV